VRHEKRCLVKITVVLPAYNEEKDLPPLLERIGWALGNTRSVFQILVVDDGSTDGTAKAVQAAAAKLPIRLVKHPRNMGLGAAIRTGLQEASREDGAVVTMDADNSHDPALIPSMVKRLQDGYDVVIASRFQKGGEEVGVPARRKLLSHTAGFLMLLAVRYPGVRDYSCGFRAYTADVLRKLPEAYGSEYVCENGFACMLELLFKLKKIHARATEVPLVLRYDRKQGDSKMKVFHTMARYGAVLWNGYFTRPRLAGERAGAPETQ